MNIIRKTGHSLFLFPIYSLLRKVASLQIQSIFTLVIIYSSTLASIFYAIITTFAINIFFCHEKHAKNHLKK